MQKLVLISFIIGWSLPLYAQAPTAADYQDALHLIDAWMSGERDYDRLPGISVCIVSDQNIIWSKGYGFADVEHKVPMQPGTICSICSISKLFTSIAVMQLVEQGKIRLDDSIRSDLPSFDLTQQYPESGPITIRSLLTHSSGLPRESDFPYWSAPDFAFPTEKQVQEKLGTQTTLYPASTYYQYSNLGMSLLGEMVEHVSGIPYARYVEDSILKPLRLSNTHPYLPENLWGGKMATGYNSLHRDGHRDKMPLFEAKGIAPAAGFSSSAEDLARFASWQFRVLRNGGKEILKASTLRDMQRVQFLDPDWKTAYGLGFKVNEYNGATLVGHGGSCPGYLSSLMMDTKQKLAIIVMINAQGESTFKYSKAIYDILKKSGVLNFKASAELQAYVGNYDGYAFSSETVVFIWQAKLGVIDLRSADPAGEMMLLRHISGDRFQVIRKDETLGEEVRFERNANGQVIKIWRHSNYQNKILP
jgi:CubicO group peptidase (beta-lactamase class C family)